MKKAIKIISVLLLALILLIILIPIVFKGKIKDMVLNEANKSLNAKLEVGKVNLSLLKSFPNVYVGLYDVIITGQGKFENDTLIKVRSLSISTGIMDLIGGSPYEIKKIKIDQADVRLKVLADEQANWDIVKPSESGSAEETTLAAERFRLLLKSLVIKDSRLVYDDFFNSTFAVLEGLNHTLNGDLGANFTTLKTHTGVLKTYYRDNGITYLRDAVINWQADLDADLVKYIYTFRDNKLTINEFPIIFQGSVGIPDEGYDIDLTYSTPDNSFKQLLSLVPAVYTQNFASVKTDGKIAFDGFAKGKYIDDQYPSFLINLAVSDAWFQYPELPSTVNDINITARIESPGGDLDNTVIDLKKFSMNMAANPVLVTLLLKNPITDPFIDTRVNVRLDMSDVKTFYPLEEGVELSGSLTADFMLKGLISDVENERYNDFEASGVIQSKGIQYSTSLFEKEILIESTNLNITAAYLDLTELRGKTGRSDFSLTGKLQNYLAYFLKDESLQGQFSLNSNLIDVNELLGLSDSPGETAATDTSVISAFIVPAGIDIALNAAASNVKYKTFDISNFTGVVRIKDEKLYFDDISMYGLGGRLQMNGSYAAPDPANPQIDFNLGVKDISFQETFRHLTVVEKFAPIVAKVIGDFSGNIKLAGLLDGQMMPRLETMTGAGDLITSTLRLSNVNTLNQLADALKMDQLKNLEIAPTKLNVQFLDGIMDLKPFDFKAWDINMKMGGQTSLDQRIAYVLNMKIPRSMFGGAANNVVNDLVTKSGQTGVDVNIGEYVNVAALIEGTISDPKVRLDLAGTGKDIVESLKDQVQEQIEEKVEEIKDQAREIGENYLQEADRQAQAILDEAQRQSAEIIKAAQNLADETKKQANASAQNLIKEAKGQGYVTELAAKKSAEEVVKQGEKQAKNILDEAGKQSASIIDKAQIEADKIKEEARKKINQ